MDEVKLLINECEELINKITQVLTLEINGNSKKLSNNLLETKIIFLKKFQDLFISQKNSLKDSIPYLSESLVSILKKFKEDLVKLNLYLENSISNKEDLSLEQEINFLKNEYDFLIKDFENIISNFSAKMNKDNLAYDDKFMKELSERLKIENQRINNILYSNESLYLLNLIYSNSDGNLFFFRIVVFLNDFFNLKQLENIENKEVLDFLKFIISLKEKFNDSNNYSGFFYDLYLRDVYNIYPKSLIFDNFNLNEIYSFINLLVNNYLDLNDSDIYLNYSIKDLSKTNFFKRIETSEKLDLLAYLSNFKDLIYFYSSLYYTLFKLDRFEMNLKVFKNTINRIFKLNDILFNLNLDDLVLKELPWAYLYRFEANSIDDFLTKFEYKVLKFKSLSEKKYTNSNFYNIHFLNENNFWAFHMVNFAQGGGAGKKELKEDSLLNLRNTITNKVNFTPSCSIFNLNQKMTFHHTGSFGVIFDYGYIYKSYIGDGAVKEIGNHENKEQNVYRINYNEYDDYKLNKAKKKHSKLLKIQLPPEFILNLDNCLHEFVIRNWTCFAIFYIKERIDEKDLEKLKEISQELSFKEYRDGEKYYRKVKLWNKKGDLKEKFFPIYEVSMQTGKVKLVFSPNKK